MYFFSDTSLHINTSTVIGYWNVAGYQQINVHAYVQGGPGSVYMESSFNNLSAYSEKLTIAAAGPGNFAVVTRTYQVYAPTLSIVLYNPSAPMDFKLRLYAACCQAPSGLIARLFPMKQTIEGDAQRKLNAPVDIDPLTSDFPPAQPESTSQP